MTDTLSPQNAALKPCPFCGGEPAVIVAGGAAGATCVKGHHVTTYGKDAAEAVAAWNTRTDPPKPAPSAEGVEAVIAAAKALSDAEINVYKFGFKHTPSLRDFQKAGLLFKSAVEDFRSLPAQSVSQTDTLAEPVAWRRRPKTGGYEWVLFHRDTGDDLEFYRNNGRYDVEPLHAAPPSPGPETGVEISEEAVERARRYLRHGNLESAEAIEMALRSIFDVQAPTGGPDHGR